MKDEQKPKQNIEYRMSNVEGMEIKVTVRSFPSAFDIQYSIFDILF